MSISKKGIIFFTALFLSIFVSLNIWIINHSGLVRVFSLLSIKYFNYWSGTLSYGMPIVLGLFFFISIFGIFYIKNIFFIHHSSQELDGVTKFHNLKEIFQNAGHLLNTRRFPIILLVIGLEMAVMNSVDYLTLSGLTKKANCNAEQITFNQCDSGWVTLAGPLKNTQPLISIEKSRNVTHYLSVKDNLPLLIKWEEFVSPSVIHEFPTEVTGVIETINPSHFVFFNKSVFPYEAEQIKILNIDRSPEKKSIFGIVISLIMAVIGLFLLLRKRANVSHP